MNTLLDWKGIEDLDGRVENVSINHVDTDGNAAVHYASMNGLLGICMCVYAYICMYICV
jgi:hypothetical protein